MQIKGARGGGGGGGGGLGVSRFWEDLIEKLYTSRKMALEVP